MEYTVHHEKPGCHWSLTPIEHKKIAHLMEARLCQTSAHGFWFERFILEPLMGVKSPYRTLPADTTMETIHVTKAENAIHEIDHTPPAGAREPAVAAEAGAR